MNFGSRSTLCNFLAFDAMVIKKIQVVTFVHMKNCCATTFTTKLKFLISESTGR